MSAWDNFIDNLKRPFKTFDRQNSNYYYNTEQALFKNKTYTPVFQPGNVSVPKGQLGTVSGGYKSNMTDTQPNYMNLILLGLGAFLIIKILD